MTPRTLKKVIQIKSMKLSILKTGQYTLLALVASTCMIVAAPTRTPALCVAPRDLNGIWKSNDGGTYYVRQMENDVWWVGMSSDNGRTWTNVFKGVRNGNTVTGQWADVPKGRISSGGLLNLRIQGTNQSVSGFTRSAVSGGFGGSQWFQSCNDTILNPVP